MYRIIALIGEAGSGKDTLMQSILSALPDLHEIISCTTRPPREGERNGVNYYFISPEEFGERVLRDEMLEACCFNDWFYGTGYESLRSDTVNIGVFNPTGIESLLARKDVEVDVFYVETRDKTRLLRQLNREENPDVHEIIRRFKADWVDFADLDFDYKLIPNENEKDLERAVALFKENYSGVLRDLQAGSSPSDTEGQK